MVSITLIAKAKTTFTKEYCTPISVMYIGIKMLNRTLTNQVVQCVKCALCTMATWDYPRIARVV
jgi:hypothetical protein